MIELNETQEAEISKALLEGDTKLTEWLEKNAPEEIQKLYSQYTTLEILKIAADYAGYTEPGREMAINITKEINTLLQMI